MTKNSPKTLPDRKDSGEFQTGQKPYSNEAFEAGLQFMQALRIILLLAVNAAVAALFGVTELKDLVDALFNRCDAARVAAFDHVFDV